jgi:hypothetical protein
MGLATFSIYKYVRSLKGSRYCRAAYAPGRKIKPNVVMVAGKEETHPEGSYYFNVDGHWEKPGDCAAQAQGIQAKRLARQRYEKDTGEKLLVPEPNGELLSDAIAAYVGELELKVAGKSRQPKTLAASRRALEEFARESGIKRLKDVTAAAIAKHMAWAIQNSPTKSARTAANKRLLTLQFLKHTGSVPTVGLGRSARPLGLKDAPRYGERAVETHTPEELARFMAACGPREEPVFQTFRRAGLREQELSTLRSATSVVTILTTVYIDVLYYSRSKHRLSWHPTCPRLSAHHMSQMLRSGRNVSCVESNSH